MTKEELKAMIEEVKKVDKVLGIYHKFIEDEFPTDEAYDNPSIDGRKLLVTYAVQAKKYNALVDASLALLANIQIDLECDYYDD
ncbi:MAG: hypothetical protein HFE63_03885 [Clostridiales bacterium]|nr:hypothetical protein [Clostridiales bacterium]